MKPSILIVDDQLDVRKVLASALQTFPEPVEVVDVPSAEEALLVVAQRPLDVLVTDFRLAGMTGLELLARVRKRNPGIRIILITGIADTKIRQQISEANADYFFFKPVPIADFLTAVKRCLAGETRLERLEEEPSLPASSVQPVSGLPSKLVVDLEKKGSEEALYNRLAEVCRLSHSTCAFLITPFRIYQVQTGNLGKGTPVQVLADALTPVLNAGAAVNAIEQETSNENLYCFTGPEYDLCVWQFTVDMAFVLGGKGVLRSGSLEFTQRLMRQIVPELHTLIANIQSETASQPVKGSPGKSAEPIVYTANPGNEPPKHGAEPGDESINPAELADAEAALDGLLVAGVRKEEINAFWEEVDNREGSGEQRDAESLSYEQARRLGLIPK